MKFPNQAKLLKQIRSMTGLSQAEFGVAIGLPGTQMVNDVENGRKPLTPARWRLLEKSCFVTKERILDACTEDFILAFEQKYEG